MKVLWPLASAAAFFLVFVSISSPVAGIQAPTAHEQQLLPGGPTGVGVAIPWLARVPHFSWLSQASSFLWRYEEDPLAKLRATEVIDEKVLELGAVAADPSGMPARRRQMYFTRDSVTFFCVMVLTLQCMVIHTALSLSRNTDELSGETEPSLLTQSLTAAARGIVYPPMMCMLFVASRLYVLATTEGQGEPQLGVKICMVAATFGMTLHFVLVLLLPTYTAHWFAEEEETGMRFEELAGEPTDVHIQMEAQRFNDEEDRATFEALQVLAVAFIYCGVAGVVVGIFTYPQGTTKVSIAVLSTVFLAMLYFGVYFLLWLGSLLGTEAAALRAAARQALFPIRKAPMLCVLFLASRIRALHLDPPNGMPPHFQQLSFVVICAALALETAAALVIGATGEEQTSHKSMPSYKSEEVSHTLMHFFAFIVYCGLVPVVYGMFVMDGANGTVSRPLSSTTSAVLQFAALYFVVHILQWCVLVLQDVEDTTFADAKAIVLAADVSVRLCPLISILFVACRLRALQLSHQAGAPQIWAQQAMFMSVFAMAVQMLSCIFLPIVQGSKAAVDGDGCADWDMRPLIIAYVVTVMKYIALFCLHGGAIMVCVAIVTMSPESTNSHQDGLLERETLKYCMVVTMASFAFALFFSFAKVLGIVFKLAVEGLDHALLGCEITVRMAAISILRGWVNIADVVIQNPDFPSDGGSASWSCPYLLKVKRVHADLDMMKLALSGGEVFEFEELILQDVDINYDKPWKMKDNVSLILDTIRSQMLPDVEQGATHLHPSPHLHVKPEPVEEPPANLDVKVIFHKIKIQNVTARVNVSGPSGLGGHLDIALANLDYSDFQEQLGDEGGDKVRDELVTFIVRSLMETVAANVGPGKNMGAMKGVTSSAAKMVSSCLQGANPCGNVGKVSKGAFKSAYGKGGAAKLALSA